MIDLDFLLDYPLDKVSWDATLFSDQLEGVPSESQLDVPSLNILHIYGYTERSFFQMI